MTAPALPGAAPDPARLPPEVEKALTEAVQRAASIGYDEAPDDKHYSGNASLDVALDRAMDSDKVAALRTAIARALGGDGEPVAWAVRSGTGEYDTFRWTAAEAHEEVARLNSDEYGHDIQKVVKRRPFTVVPLYTRPAATGDTAEVENAARTAALYVDEAWRKGAPKSAWHPIKATLMRDAIRAATGGPDAR